jgi:hypothetical protein
MPLILSDIAANRDLGLDDRFYFDPRDPAHLAATVAKALAKPDDYLVPPESFEGWDAAVDSVLRLTGIVS